MGDPEATFKKLSKIFSVKVREMDMTAFRECLLEAAPYADKMNLNRQFSKNSSSFLHTAIWYRHTELTRWLLAWKADPNLQNLRGITPMHFLAENIARKGDTVSSCLRMLVKAGGNMDLKNKQGLSSWDIIKSKKMEGTAKEYLKGIKRVRGARDAWRKQILNYYDDSEVEEDEPLQISEISDKLGDSSLLSDSDSSAVEAKETKKQRAERVYKELVQLLALQKGDLDENQFCKIIRDNRDIIKSGHLNLNQTTTRTGASLLHACVWYMKVDCVKTLVEVGQADVMLKNAKGLTPLHSAAERGHKENVKQVIDILMSNGASKTAKSNRKKTPPEKAKIPEIAEYILGWPHGSPFEQQEEEKSKLFAAGQNAEAEVVAEGALVAVDRWEYDWSEMKILFDKMDWDKNNFLSRKDIRDSLVNMDHTFGPQNVDQMLKSGDPDGDGQISWEEFKAVIQNYTEIPRIKIE